MKQLENNPQVLYKQEDGEGWGHCFVRGKTLYMYACLVRSRRGNSRSIKQECLCVSLLCKTVQGPQCHLAETLPLINCDLGRVFNLREGNKACLRVCCVVQMRSHLNESFSSCCVNVPQSDTFTESSFYRPLLGNLFSLPEAISSMRAGTRFGCVHCVSSSCLAEWPMWGPNKGLLNE